MTTPDQTSFIPITKVDAERREVWGWGAVEMPDASDEIMDYKSSKPLFMEWSNAAQKRSGGKSLGNLRSMHQTKVAGKLIDFRPDDQVQGFYVGAKIVDDDEWNKVVEGVYTGFSIGGSYQKRWPDEKKPGLIRYTAKPTELSIVDAPCIPGATFQMVKAEGIQSVEFRPGNAGDGLVLEPEAEDIAAADELNKAVNAPGAPEPVAGTAVEGAYMTITLHHMPEPNRTIIINTRDGNSGIPSGVELGNATVKTQELIETVAALVKGMPSMISNSVAAALETELNKLVDDDGETDEEEPGVRHMIKVVRKGVKDGK